MTIRPNMVGDALPTEDEDTPMPDIKDTQVRVVPAEEDRASKTPSPNPSPSARSKVSSLRAAFEQSGSNTSISRPLSVDGRTLAPNGRSSSLDVDVARMKDALARAQSERESYRLQLKQQEAETEERRSETERQRAEIEQQRAKIEQQKAENEQQKSQIETLQAQIQQLESKYAAQGEESSSQADAVREELNEAIHEARAQAQRSESESNALRSQLSELKKSIATNTRIENHEVTDSAFQNELATLCYQLQDWVINRFRKTKIEGGVEELVARATDAASDGSTEALRLVLSKWDPSAKMLVMQSVVVTLLLPILQDPVPFGLPSDVEWADSVRTASRKLRETMSTTSYHRWRSTTFDIICHSDAILPYVDAAASKLVLEICNAIDKITVSTTNETQTDSLRLVVARFITLSHSLRAQRAVYDVQLPETGTAFDAERMEDVADDYEGPEERTIVCSLFPVVFKLGNVEQRSVVFRARVA